MNVEQNRRDFIAALRSGDYPQGKDRLFNPDTECYCVFGVAEHLALKWKSSRHCPSRETIAWLGLELHDPHNWASNDLVTELIEANDLGRMTFEEMADMLERLWFSGAVK